MCILVFDNAPQLTAHQALTFEVMQQLVPDGKRHELSDNGKGAWIAIYNVQNELLRAIVHWGVAPLQLRMFIEPGGHAVVLPGSLFPACTGDTAYLMVSYTHLLPLPAPLEHYTIVRSLWESPHENY